MQGLSITRASTPIPYSIIDAITEELAKTPNPFIGKVNMIDLRVRLILRIMKELGVVFDGNG